MSGTTKLTLEYHGAEFAGWARQPGLRSVQQELETALHTILGQRDQDGAELVLSVAGRTDRGVHAWGQVASYRHEALDPVRLNALLPADIAVLASEPAPAEFDARHDAVSRTYCYRVLARRQRTVFSSDRAWWVPQEIDLQMLQSCAAVLIGTHDFTAFTPTETDHVRFERDIHDARWSAQGDLLEFWITADTFMRHMNRTLVGTMLEVARHRRSLDDFTGLLDGAPRSQAGPTAPAHGLALASVGYPSETTSAQPHRPI